MNLKCYGGGFLSLRVTSPAPWKLGRGGVLPKYVKRLILNIQHRHYMPQQKESKKHYSCILSPIQVRVFILEPNDKQQDSSSGITGHLNAATGLFGIVVCAGIRGKDICLLFCLL